MSQGFDIGIEGHGVLITGASGGIGRALAEVFAECGATLVLHANTQRDALSAWVHDQPWKDRATLTSADLRCPDATEAMFESSLAQLGRIDCCIANAGIWLAGDTPLHEQDPRRTRDVIETNLLGAAWTARSFVRGLARTGPRPDGVGASLCLIGSTAGRFGEPGHAEYAASKAGLYGLVRSLKTEIVAVDPRARVNMVEPGWTLTDRVAATAGQPGNVERVAATRSLAQLAHPRDIARAALGLSSPRLSRHVTGEILTVSGGMEGRLLRSPDAVDGAAVLADSIA